MPDGLDACVVENDAPGHPPPDAPDDMPHNIEVEQALLGAILLSARAYEAVCAFLRPDHFATPVHDTIFAACARLIDEGKPATPVSLGAHIAADPLVREAGGARYLAELADAAVTIVNAREYGQQILDLALRREVILTAREVMARARTADLDTSARTVAEAAAARLDAVIHGGAAPAAINDVGQVAYTVIKQWDEALRSPGALRGLSTGLADLDRTLGGLKPGDLAILAGRPAMGKTALALSIAAHNARTFHGRDSPHGGPPIREQGARVAFVSLEMSQEQLAERVLSTETSVNILDADRGRIGAAQFESAIAAGRALRGQPLWFLDRGVSTVRAIAAACRRIVRRHGLDLIVVDYLQLIAPDDPRANRTAQVTAISNALKALAMDLRVPVLALSQLSRAVESRDNKRPMLSDLRDSGSLEQDADKVMMVYREHYYIEHDEPVRRRDQKKDDHAASRVKWLADLQRTANLCEIIVAKHRRGKTGTVKVHCDLSTFRFSNLADAKEGELGV